MCPAGFSVFLDANSCFFPSRSLGKCLYAVAGLGISSLPQASCLLTHTHPPPCTHPSTADQLLKRGSLKPSGMDSPFPALLQSSLQAGNFLLQCSETSFLNRTSLLAICNKPWTNQGIVASQILWSANVGSQLTELYHCCLWMPVCLFLLDPCQTVTITVSKPSLGKSHIEIFCVTLNCVLYLSFNPNFSFFKDIL